MNCKLKRIFLLYVVCISCIIPALIFALSGINTAHAQEKGIKIAVISDIHFFDMDWIKSEKDEEQLENSEASDRKMLRESKAILEAALTSLEEESPDIVLIPGDLTRDGERNGHKYVAEQLKAFEKKMAGIGTQVFVVNGNHDINNPKAAEFSQDETSPKDFREIYDEFGFNSATAIYTPTEGKQGGLSYETRPIPGLTILALDSGHYSEDANGIAGDMQTTSGGLTSGLTAWAEERAQLAAKRGDAVIALAHHLFLPHFDGQTNFFSDYIMTNWQTNTEKLADAGVRYTFTGHMHVNDIAEFSTKKGNKLYDISTGSAVTYPSAMRVLNLNFEGGFDSLLTKLDVKAKYIKSANGIENLTEYGKEVTAISKDKLGGILDSLLGEYINDMKENGVLNYVANILGETVTGASVNFDTLVAGLNALSFGKGIGSLPFTIGELEYIVSVKNGAVVLSNEVGETLNLKINDLGNDLKTLGVATDEILTDIDERMAHIVEKIYGDEEYTLFGSNYNLGSIVNTAYQMHLAGNENAPEELLRVLDECRDGKFLTFVLDKILLPELGNVSNVLFEMDSINSLLDFVKIEKTESVSLILTKLLANSTLDIERMMTETLVGMTKDTNYPADLETTLNVSYYEFKGHTLAVGIGVSISVLLCGVLCTILIIKHKKTRTKSA